MASDTSLPIREWTQPIDGAAVSVRAVGEGDGGPVPILAHVGPRLSHDCLQDLEVPASETLRVVAYDQRGIERSTGEPTRGNLIPEYAEEIDALPRAVGVGQVSVLGHSRNLGLTGCGRSPWIEGPDRFYPEVRSFLAEIIGSSTPLRVVTS